MPKFLAAMLIIFSFASCSFAVDSDDRVCIGVMEFESSTYDVPDRKAAEISDIFARILLKSDRIKIIERKRLYEIISEAKLTMSRLIDDKTAIEAGKIAGCDYVLMGTITDLVRANSKFGIPSFGIPVLSGIGVNNERVKATIDVRLVDVKTGNLFLAESAYGLAKKSRANFIISGVSVENSGLSGLEVNAILKAAVVLAPKIEKAVTGYDTLTEKIKADTKAAKKKKKTKTTTASKSKSESKTAKKTEKLPELNPELNTETSSGSIASGETAITERENESTDPAKVISSYGLPAGETNILRIKHINLKNQESGKDLYQEYTKLFDEYNGDYFAAFRAGEVASDIGDKTNAELWFEKSLAVNPNYEPAKNALKKLSEPEPEQKIESEPESKSELKQEPELKSESESKSKPKAKPKAKSKRRK